MIIRSTRPERFVILSNDLVRDRRLSWKARGLLAYLLSMPDGWQTSSERLAKEGPDGRDSVRSGLSNLEDAGYLVRTKVQDELTGLWSTVSTVYDRPCGPPVDNQADDTSTDDGLSDAGKPVALRSTNPRMTDVVQSQNCSRCDGTGWEYLEAENGVVRCTHQPVVRALELVQ